MPLLPIIPLRLLPELHYKFPDYGRPCRWSTTTLDWNAYGMYLVHYAFVSWLQYALWKAQLLALAKGSAVFIGAVTLSWMLTAILRRSRMIARVI